MISIYNLNHMKGYNYVGFLLWNKIARIIQQSLVISVQNVSPPATAFVSSGHCIRLLQLSHSTPQATAFVSSGHCIRLLQLSHSSPPVTAFDSFSYRIRLLQPLHSTPSAIAFVSFSHCSRMCKLNEVDEVVKWSGWVRIMKFMISAQLSIHANGKAKSGLLLPLWFLCENVFLFLLPHLPRFA